MFKKGRITQTRRTTLLELTTRVNRLAKTNETKSEVEVIGDGTECRHNAL